MEASPDSAAASPLSSASASSPVSEEDKARERGVKLRSSNILPSYVIGGSFISVLMGYDLGVLGAALYSVQHYYHLDDVQLGLLLGSFPLVSIVAAPLGSIIAEMHGRKFMLLLSSVVCGAGLLLMATAQTYEQLLIGRCFAGAGVGGGGSQASVYLAEMSPSSKRGLYVGQIEVCFNVGIFLGFFLGMMLGHLPAPTDFRLMFGFGALIAACILPVVLMIPESPRWLLSRRREEEAYRIMLECTGEEEANRTMHEFKTATQSSYGLRDLFSAEGFHSVTVGILLVICISFCGIDAVTYYSDRMLRESGVRIEVERRQAMVLMALIKLSMVIIASMNMDKVGRIWSMCVSFGGMLVATIAFLIPGTSMHSPMLGCAGIFSFAGCFSVGVGPCFYLMAAEIWPQRLRSVGSGFLHSIRGLLGFISTTFFLLLMDKYSCQALLCGCAVSSMLGIVIVRNMLPETGGRSLEEIVVTQRNSIRSLQRRSSFELGKGMATGSAWGDGDGPEPNPAPAG